jgi:hypothetical protein
MSKILCNNSQCATKYVTEVTDNKINCHHNFQVDL